MQNEMPREKLLRVGPDGLKDEELLSLILHTGYKGKHVLSMSKSILQKYHKQLFNLSYKELSNIKGIGWAKASTIIAAKELFVRHFYKNSIPKISTPEDVIANVQEICSRKKENFVVLYLNARNELIYKEFISVGSLTASIVHPREVFYPAIKHHAVSIILTHNHPSGDPTPSIDDKELTKKLIESSKILSIDIIDHIIVTINSYFSFREKIGMELET